MTTLRDALRAELRAALARAGITQAAAARRLGISPKHLSQMLTGKAGVNLDIATLCGRELAIRSRRARRSK
ncbi:Helix-turn-helix [Sinosporangium album]|uniref:Helix-turn-helix n=1 Tax=Sinosporangium album TaxID=504805 RepID=A0A1G8EI40_9ACTN|nr:helix-turn-helix domain-containing protein [Sinosporangium album]SDH69578.1 Helix-turn-helix [Sinosporangium album]